MLVTVVACPSGRSTGTSPCSLTTPQIPLFPLRRDFPILPIVTPDPPPRSRSQAERFGALFYLGVVGLIVLLTLVGWFGWSVWTLRSIWWNVYVLHDPKRPDADRNAAAYAFSHDPAVNQRQLWDVALRKDLPPLARYVVAEGLTDEAAAADPKGYGLAVVRSEGWPDWLRLLLLRPLAYRAAAGHPLPREALAELRQTRDLRHRALGNLCLGGRVGGRPRCRRGAAPRRDGGISRTTRSRSCCFAPRKRHDSTTACKSWTKRRSGSVIIIPKRRDFGTVGRS